MTNFEKVLRSIIKKSGGSPQKIRLENYMEKFSHCFAFAPENYFLGITIMKNPLDLAILQQIIFDNKPDTIIECGTAFGGSALFLACMLDLMNINGQVITIDHVQNQATDYHKKEFIKIENKIASLDIQAQKMPNHPKIKYITSDCLKAKLPKLGKKVMVILDCHHSASHVYKELIKYSSVVTLNQYLIVEDTDAKDKKLGGGPLVAVKKFLKLDKNFIPDKNREKYGVSSNLGGFLLKIS